MDVGLMVLLLSAVFGLVGSLALAHFLLRATFRFRPSPPEMQRLFFHPATIGALVTVPPMGFLGFVIFSMVLKDVSIMELKVGVEQQRLLGGLLALGLLIQLLLGQRLSLLSETVRTGGQRLVIDRLIFGSFCSIARSDIASIGLYPSALNSRNNRIQLCLQDGTTTRLAFGEEILAELRQWAGQA
jgi:hypothetical protein